MSNVDGLLFSVPVQSRETDERYTPRWVFDALGESFDLDPASPAAGISQVPASKVYTKDDDGLTRPWFGFVWCNPPFSHATAWADRFIEHGSGIWLGPVANGGWHDRMTRASDALVLLRDFPFIAPTHAGKRSSMPLSLHAFGRRARYAVERFALARPEAGVILYRPGMFP